MKKHRFSDFLLEPTGLQGCRAQPGRKFRPGGPTRAGPTQIFGPDRKKSARAHLDRYKITRNKKFICFLSNLYP